MSGCESMHLFLSIDSNDNDGGGSNGTTAAAAANDTDLPTLRNF